MMTSFKLKNKVLILGKMPPPIGGVRIHIYRLIADLHKREYRSFHFYDFEKEPVWKVFLKIPQYKVIHLHTSNTYFQLIVAIYCVLTSRKLIITYHGNWGRYGILKNLIALLSAWYASVAIVQNQESLKKVMRWNKNSFLISAFIPPSDIIRLNNKIYQELLDYKKNYKYLFCTNASNLAFDINGDEIYGISGLMANISQNPASALIISDPSGTYKKYIQLKLEKIPKNIFFIVGTHDFLNVLKLSDAFIRNTTTDGDSISIHESLSFNIPVFATNCISRPPKCHLFKDIAGIDFAHELKQTSINYKEEFAEKDDLDTTGRLILLYNGYLF